MLRRATRPRSKRKPVAYELIVRDSAAGRPMYALLEQLVTEHHDELREARIALAWCMSWKPDADGRVTLGKCKKASDLDRELAAFDFIILLRKLFWEDLFVSEDQRRALLDHELMHAAVKYDEHGEPALDERGRIVYRTRKHDIEEFTAVVERHGVWKRDLERFAVALARRARGPFVPCDTCKATPEPGWILIRDAAGVERRARCQCWVQWVERHTEAKSA